MLKKTLEEIICQALIDCYSDLIVARLQSRQQKALVLFTGSSIGLDQALISLTQLREQGWTLDVVLSPQVDDGMRRQVAREFTIVQWPVGGPLLARYGVLLVPTLSITVAAKTALLIRDSFASQLFASALEQGLRIVAATDACCPVMLSAGPAPFRVADAYQQRMRQHLVALQDYGVTLVSASRLGAAVQKLTAAGKAGVPSKAVATRATSCESLKKRTASVARHSSTAVKLESAKRLFSRSDALQYRDCELRLAAGVLVTPLALDELRTRNVRLITE